MRGTLIRSDVKKVVVFCTYLKNYHFYDAAPKKSYLNDRNRARQDQYYVHKETISFVIWSWVASTAGPRPSYLNSSHRDEYP